MESRLSQRLSKYISFVSKYSLNVFLNFTGFNGLRIQDSSRAAVSMGGGKAPSLLFHLQNNTSLHDMETKLCTHINKTLAMCLEKKFRE